MAFSIEPLPLISWEDEIMLLNYTAIMKTSKTIADI